MRIGILTYHRLLNDGAVMQALALHERISGEFPGSAVELIDYTPRTLARHNLRLLLRKRLPTRIYGTWQRRRSLIQLIEAHAQCSLPIVADDLDSAQSALGDRGYDLVVVGSDTVWNLAGQPGFPRPPNLFFSPTRDGAAVALAYAVSMDPLRESSRAMSTVAGRYAVHWRRFRSIGYRDEATGQLLKHTLGSDIPLYHAPDPTFHVCLKQFTAEVEPFSTRPVMGIAVGFCDRCLVRELATAGRRAGFRVINFNVHSRQEHGIQRVPVDLPRRLGLLKRCSLLITDRFHTSIFFARLARRPMAFVEHRMKWPLPNSKGRDLYRRLGVEECVVRAAPRRLEGMTAADLIAQLTDPSCPAPDDRPLCDEAEEAFQHTFAEFASPSDNVQKST